MSFWLFCIPCSFILCWVESGGQDTNETLNVVLIQFEQDSNGRLMKTKKMEVGMLVILMEKEPWQVRFKFRMRLCMSERYESIYHQLWLNSRLFILSKDNQVGKRKIEFNLSSSEWQSNLQQWGSKNSSWSHLVSHCILSLSGKLLKQL